MRILKEKTTEEVLNELRNRDDVVFIDVDPVQETLTYGMTDEAIKSISFKQIDSNIMQSKKLIEILKKQISEAEERIEGFSLVKARKEELQ